MQLIIFTILFCLIITATSIVGVGQDLPKSTDDEACGCEKYSISSEIEMVKAGESVEFEVKTDESILSPVGYSWSVNLGQIVAGNGTPRIKVQTSESIVPVAIPQPTPDSIHGFFGSLRRKWPKIEVLVEIINGNCSCIVKLNDVSVGLRTLLRNRPADVSDLSLSSDLLILPCAPGQRPGEGQPSSSKTMVLDIGTTAIDPDDDVLAYSYSVSGGRIIGNGAKVQWDLADTTPGTYTITAGVDDGCGICGKTVTRTITVIDCTPSCALPPSCPHVEIQSQEVLDSFTEYFFLSKILGADGLDLEWTVENGEVVEGQGTRKIRVRTGSISDSDTFGVSLKLSGFHPFANCPETSTIKYRNQYGQFVRATPKDSPK